MQRKTYRIISYGGLGDALLTTPVFKAIKNKYPDSIIKVYCAPKNHKEIYENNPYIDTLKTTSIWDMPVERAVHGFRVLRYRSQRRLYKNRYHDNLYGKFFPSKTYSIQASRIIAETMEIELGDTDLQIFLTQAEEAAAAKVMAAYKNPVTIQITSITSANQNWPIQNWNKLVAATPECTFIQLGLLNEAKVEGAVDLRGKTSVREAIALLKYSKSFVGVVSSMAHATNAVGVPGVILFGASCPKVWGHPNNINIFKNTPCAPCIDTLLNIKCPYGSLCMSTISVEEVRDAVLKQTLEPVLV